jgi:Mg-chelatase subunit ChlD
MSTQITGSIVDSFCTLEVTQRFVNKWGTDTECAVLMQGTDGYVIYDIQIVKGTEALVFNIRGLDDDQLTRIGQYNTMAFGKSTNDILLNIGVVPQDVIVQLQYGISFTGRISSPMELVFEFPYDEKNANTTAFMDVSVDNAAGVASATLEGCGSTFSGGRLTFSKQTITDQPIVRVRTQNEQTSTGIATVVGQDRYIGLSIIPTIAGGEIKSEIVCLVDCSGSMAGEAIEWVKKSLSFLLTQLPKTCYFNMLFFSSGFRSLFPESVSVSASSTKQAQAAIAGLTAGGGTELFSPLQHVYGTPPRRGFVRQIFVLTDGQVQGEADILSLVAQHRHSQRIFSLGIGSAVARAFIEEIATRSSGHAAFVDPKNLTAATQQQLGYAMREAVASPQVEIGQAAVEVSPFPIPPLFNLSVSNVFLRTVQDAGDDVLVTGNLSDSSYETIVRTRPSPANIALAKFHAFFNIKDLQDKVPLASPEEARQLKTSIIALSQRSGLISDFTAMFTVLEGAHLHFLPSLGQERFASMQPFTQGQSRGQERFRCISAASPRMPTSGIGCAQPQMMMYHTASSPLKQRSGSFRGIIMVLVIVAVLIVIIFFIVRYLRH